MWDANADGYARGEGFASVILKTLSQALADGDPIECIIRETGVNQVSDSYYVQGRETNDSRMEKHQV
jgi:acyl transferase domain-containing protein